MILHQGKTKIRRYGLSIWHFNYLDIKTAFAGLGHMLFDALDLLTMVYNAWQDVLQILEGHYTWVGHHEDYNPHIVIS